MSDNNSPLKQEIPWLYFLAMFSQLIGGTMATTYTMFYMTERMLVPVVIVGAILFAARIVDLVFSVLVGVIVQKITPKHGQYRSWLFYGPVMVALGTTLTFINFPVPIPIKAAQVFIAYAIYGAGASFIQLSQSGLMAKISGPNMRHRITISGRLNQGSQAGRIISSMIMMPMILFIDKLGPDGYTFTQIGMAVFGLLGQLPLFFRTREYDRFDPEVKNQGAPAALKLSVMFSTVLKNGQLLILMLADSLRYAAYMGLAGLGVYYFRYVAQNMGLFTVALTVQSFSAFGVSLIMPAVARKIGKKNAGIIAGVFMTIFLAALAWQGMISPWIYMVCVAGFYASFGLILACGVNLYLDCGEYQLYKSGADARTFTMGMYGVAIKIGFLISTVLTTVVLAGSGYSGTANTVANLRLMALLLGGVPAGLTLVYTLLITAAYGITEEKSKEYAEHNHKAAAEKAQVAATG
jgi:Na+/melibiose symporter-like transporter